jgi:glycosyltransferase involved in cell wall biosynthesis
MIRDGLNILQVSTADQGGGAERIAVNLHTRYIDRGHQAVMAVGRKSGSDSHVVEIPNTDSRNAWTRIWAGATYQLHTHEHRLGNTHPLRTVTEAVGRPNAWLDEQLGREHYGFPGTKRVVGLGALKPDLIHLHNLHGGYFDLRQLPQISMHAPVFVTMHDAWMLAGHCAHSLGCDRWQTGCGKCPALGTYPAVKRDSTARNWRRKRNIYAASRVYLTAPSQWLLKKAKQSMLAPAVMDSRVIPNGVDLSVFHPGDQADARHRLALPENAYIILFAANGIRQSDFKDFDTLREAVRRVGEAVIDRPVLCVALGEAGETQHIGKSRIEFVSPQSDSDVVADYYRAADVYAHAAKEDTFPTTVIEAMACGTPVVASAVGGIPEQVEHNQTGLLVSPGDATLFAKFLAQLLNNPVLRRTFAEESAGVAIQRFDVEIQVASNLAWYEEVVRNVRSQGTRLAA